MPILQNLPGDQSRKALSAIIVMCALLSASAALCAQQGALDKGDPIVAGMRWTMHSKLLGEDRTVSVRLPDGYSQTIDRYPVLYALDGEQCFGSVSGVAQALPWARRAPDLIVVAIHNVSRVRDFTTPWTAPIPPGSSQWMVSRAGGADRFLEFLKTELIPEIDRRYRTSPFRILLGHSLGGLFALHAFSAQPGLFSATIALSPAASWNGDEVIHHLDRLFKEQQSNSGFLFVDRAAKEFDETPAAVEKINDVLRLRAPSTLRWQTHVVNGEDHGTAFLPGVQAGLEFVFVDWRLPQLVFEEGLDSSLRYYEQLSALYGFRIVIPEGEISALAARAPDAKESARIYERYAEIYPQSVTALAGLAAAKESAGDLQLAASIYAKAVELAETSRDPRRDELKRRQGVVSLQLGNKR